MVKYSMMRNSLMTSFFSWSKCWIFRIMPLQWLYNKSKPNAVLMIQSLFYWIFNFNPTQLPNKHLFWLLLSSRTVMAWGCFDVQQSKVQSPNPLGILWDDWTIILEIKLLWKLHPPKSDIYIYILLCLQHTGLFCFNWLHPNSCGTFHCTRKSQSCRFRQHFFCSKAITSMATGDVASSGPNVLKDKFITHPLKMKITDTWL